MGQRGFFSFLSSSRQPSSHVLSVALLAPLLLGALLAPSSSEPFLRVVTTAVPSEAATSPAVSRRNSPGERDVTVQLFQHRWDAVADECENWLGPAGVGWAQVSPPSEHVQGPEWFTDYQPVSYIILSKRGTRDEFLRMVQRCRAAGVRVLVDAVINHMAGPRTGERGVAGSRFEHYEYPGIFQAVDFHECRPNGDKEIKSYQSRHEVQNCELLGLADLATETPHVVARLGAYLNDLTTLGVDGFRVDSAKHVASDDISRILQKVKGDPFVVQEVAFGQDEPIQPEEYLQNGHVHEFRSAFNLKQSFTAGGIAELVRNDWGRDWVPSERAVPFVVNHDTERQGTTLNFNSPGNAHALATIFLLAHPYGSPAILSSYDFSTDSQGPPRALSGFTEGIRCGVGTWRCEHRNPTIMNMIGLHNAARGLPMVSERADGQDRIAFGRGDIGHVLINNMDEFWLTSVQTTVPDGHYCDLIHDRNPSPKVCDSYTVTVQQGSASVVVPPRDALAFMIGRGPGNETSTSNIPRITPLKVSVEVHLVASTVPGETITMVGESATFGSWEPSKGLAMVPGRAGWTAQVDLRRDAAVEFKFVKTSPSGNIEWEPGANRVLRSPHSGSVRREFGWPSEL